MSTLSPPDAITEPLRRLAGYLNFSSGTSDPATFAAWNQVYQQASAGDPLSGPPAWLVLKDWMNETLDSLQASQSAFRDTSQAKRVVKILWSDLLPAYVDYHRDLLFHQQPELLFNGFFMGRAADVILAIAFGKQDSPLSDDAIVEMAIEQLNDYVGYRPVPVLENRRCEPYPHEFVRPIPLYIAGAGISAGPYHKIIASAIEVLRNTDPEILRAAAFDLDRVDELSLDPRAFDFDHPVNRRPNYHFGGWDTRSITLDGYFNRFVLRQVTLDALLSRLREPSEIDPAELLSEAATVLAGTILMASGISGWGPGAYTSDITLTSLMKPIALYRDAFYEDRLQQLTGEHAERLAREQQMRRQPFGAVRQHLNAALAERRAVQVQHVQLARMYARMGYPDAAKRQADTVPAASARMFCRIDCDITLGLRALRAGKLEDALRVPSESFDLLRRSIECGAVIDPWDILGFGGNFSLYPSPECSVHDARVDDLLFMIEQIFSYMARVWSEAAAQNNQAAYDEMELRYREMAEWWRQFAAHTIDSIEAVDPLESYDSAKLVARALRLWHEGGAEAGNIAFWAPHAEMFDSPRAYALVISALLDRDDFTPAMALLVYWLNNADRVGLRVGGSSLPRLAERWLLRLRFSLEGEAEAYVQPALKQSAGKDTAAIWPLVRKFFDYLEANAESFWSAPNFNLDQSPGASKNRDWDRELLQIEEESEDEGGLYDAAYEDMSYRDTTDDGNEGAIYEYGDDGSRDELEAESKRLTEHLSFLQSLARMWAVAADIAVMDQNESDLPDRVHSLESWGARARENRIGLLELLDAVRRYKITPGGSDKESMRNYDRHRVLRDSLMERIIGTAVEMSDSRRLVCGSLLAHPTTSWNSIDPDHEMLEDDAQSVKMFAALIGGDSDEVRQQFPPFLAALRDKNLLYIPLSRGGDPVKIYVARLRQRVLRHLMLWLPRRGLIAEACRLIETAREMEQLNPIGIGAVTEFDGLFQVGFRSLVASIVESVRINSENSGTPVDEDALADALIPLLERLTETLLGSWLAHSQTLRLSPLETVTDPKKWALLVEFIKEYGDPIFTQMFLQLGNVRAILHQGVDAWLERVIQEGDDQFCDTKLFQDLESGALKISRAERPITLVYESLIDHHAEYLDYNSTTTQSDRGDLVYMFLDFLRLRVRYERIAWNLKPVMWAHEVLVRSGLEAASVLWRRSLSERIDSEAEIYVKKLRQMQKDYAMRMPTVADRILERFVQPMTIDRMRALVGPAMRDAENNQPSRAFELLEAESEILTRHPTGVGLDVPAWLDALEEEVEQLAKRRISSEIDPQFLITIPIASLSVEELNDQLTLARSQGRRLPHMK
ncbi:hypothetical protein Pla52o_09400 [Novipirellula galeiformis]|uniref:Uncharacterized protein n=1 Tax=Novipirellula galeiformis TaxID=2528004 RepID=A0A5C6CUK1_9BACT|nr:hypothetical protein [Novipirellula galeiformis]TWU27081.1 hypothetical protein Pla52o_09400 [Novipirellula galeiformis]